MNHKKKQNFSKLTLWNPINHLLLSNLRLSFNRCIENLECNIEYKILPLRKTFSSMKHFHHFLGFLSWKKKNTRQKILKLKLSASRQSEDSLLNARLVAEWCVTFQGKLSVEHLWWLQSYCKLKPIFYGKNLVKHILDKLNAISQERTKQRG